MIEAIIIQYLNETLGLPVYAEVPAKAEKEFCIVEKTGSSTQNYIRSATVAVQSYSDSLLKAAKLNERVIRAMEELSGLEEVSSCDLNSDYNYTDTSTKRYRYQAVFDITHFN